MSPAAIVAAVTRLGVELRVLDGDRVQLRPVAAVPDDLRAAIRQHRREVAAYLRRQHSPGYTDADYEHREAAAIGTARPPEPHRRCPSCRGGLQPGDADNAICSTCQWYAAHVMRGPARMQ